MAYTDTEHTDLLQFESDRKRNLKRNYASIVGDGTFWGCGFAFVQPESTLPGIAGAMGAPDWMLGLMPIALMMGYYITPMLTVHHVQKLNHMMPFAFIFGVIQRTSFLLAAAVLYFWGDSHPMLGLASLFLAPFMCGVFGGIGMSAWVAMVSRCLPEKYRASNMAMRALFGALLGVGAGEIIKIVLEAYPNTTGYALLHLLAYVFLMLSVVSLRLTKEPIPPQSLRKVDAETESTGFISTMKRVPGLMMKDVRLRYAFFANFTGNGHYIFIPFLAVHAIKATGAGEGFLGFLIQGQMVGMIAGNVLAMLWGDRVGCFRLMFATRMLFLVVAISVFLPLGSWGYFGCFVLYGMGLAGVTVLNTTLPMEVAPLSRVPFYASLLFTLNLPALIFVWVVGWSAKSIADNIYLPASLGAILLCVSAFFSLILQNTRKKGQSA